MVCEDQQIRLDRKHTGQNKDGIHRENVHMCNGEKVEDGAHCLGVVCWMKRIQKERTKDSSLVGMKDMPRPRLAN